ncbi:hypothetical protein QE152_g30555 [Popillia japonica]|uniref:Uncharacterized protein n=1 Tax=Popillia japonica TaxID=7064 RepID=A0AAW1JEE0_POPJA
MRKLLPSSLEKASGAGGRGATVASPLHGVSESRKKPERWFAEGGWRHHTMTIETVPKTSEPSRAVNPKYHWGARRRVTRTISTGTKSRDSRRNRA